MSTLTSTSSYCPAASYRCPVCNAPKRRFKPYNGSGRNDAKSMATRMKDMKRGGGAAAGGSDASGAIGIVAVGAVVLVGLYFGLNSMYN